MNRSYLTGIRGHLPIIGIFLIGAVLRFSGLDWGIASLEDFRLDGRTLSIQQAGFHPDANNLTTASQSLSRSIHPHYTVDGEQRLLSVYGPVFMYLFWILGKVVSVIVGFDLFDLQNPGDANWTRLVGRGLSAAAGTLTILLTYRIGTRCYGRTAGLVGAFLLAVTPLSIQSSHFCTVDVLLTLWITVAFLAILGVLEKGEMRNYALAGGAIGLGCATKLHAIQLFVPLLAAHLISLLQDDDRQGGIVQTKHRVKRENRKKRLDLIRATLLALFDRRLFVSLGAAVGAFMILVPSSVLRFGDYFDPENFLAATTGILINVGEVMMRGSLHFAGTPPYLYHLTNLFPAGMGIPLEIVVFCGIAWAAYRRSRKDLLLLSFVLFYFLATGRFQGKYIRYFVLWMPFVTLLSARFLVEMYRSGRFPVRIAGIACGSLVLLYTSANAVAYTGIYRNPDVRVEAARWVAENVDAGSVVLLERGHNGMRELLSPNAYDLWTIDIDDHIVVDQNTSGVRPNRLFPSYYSSALYQVYMRHADYLVLSDDRLASRGRLPFPTMYYDTLMEGGFGYTLVRKFEIVPGFFGIPFDDRGADVTWRQFDHPQILVFERSGEASSFDANYRSYLPLVSARQAYRTFRFSVEFKDILLLHGCLLGEVRARVRPEELIKAVDVLSGRPDLLERLSDPRFAVEEVDGWGIDLPKFTAEVARDRREKG